jgi:polyhydroxyalkanoate synthesis regulator phasin
MAENRNRYLKELIEEYIEAGIGVHHWSELLDKMIEDGHVTIEEIAREFGKDGFQRSIIRPVQKSRDATGRDKYVVTKSGGIQQAALAFMDDMVRVYYERKHHIDASTGRLSIYRDQIIDLHGIDPEDVADPFEVHDGE